jgi:hypothetical protein
MTICNLEYLKNVTPGSNDFPIQIIELFIKNLPNQILKTKIALENANCEDIYNFTHKIKPSLTMLGFSFEIIETLLKINEFSKNCINLDQIPTLLYHLENELDKAYIELQAELIELKK